MRSWKPALGCAAAAFLACNTTGDVGTIGRAQIAEAVAGQLNVWTRAVNNRSLDTLALLYIHSPDLAAVWIDGEQTRGWKEASAKWKRWSDSLSQLNFVMENPAIEVLDREVALTTFRTTIDAQSGTARARRPGRGTLVWMRDPADGRWRIRAEHQSVLPEKR